MAKQQQTTITSSTNQIKIVPPCVAKTENQRLYIETILQNILTLCLGPSGSGKTFCSVGIAANYLYKGKVDQIIFLRPMVEACQENIGFLPGNLSEKTAPYTLPLYDELHHFFDSATIKEYKNFGKIRTIPIAFCRGLTFKNAFVVCDESQNMTLESLKLVLTRLGENSKLVISGDISQSDISLRKRGGLETLITRLEGMAGVGVVKLTTADIVRSGFVAQVLDRLGI